MGEGDKPQTFVYVDGFNFYYGAVRGTRYKWLNLRALLDEVLRKNDVGRIYYFTALVKPTQDDPQKPSRQQTYIRALQTLNDLEVEYGQYVSKVRELRRADNRGTLEVRWRKEKGSDVNLATRLMDDFYQDRFEAAAVVSNDSDLAAPIRTINSRREQPVGIVIPTKWKNEPSQELTEAAAFRYRIRKKALRESQFPETVTDNKGNEYVRPGVW